MGSFFRLMNYSPFCQSLIACILINTTSNKSWGFADGRAGMRYLLPWFPLSDALRRCIRRTTTDCCPYRSFLLGCQFGRSGSSGFVASFAIFVGPVVYLCQGVVAAGIGVDIGISAVRSGFLLYMAVAPNEASMVFEVDWNCLKSKNRVRSAPPSQNWRFCVGYGLLLIWLLKTVWKSCVGFNALSRWRLSCFLFKLV